MYATTGNEIVVSLGPRLSVRDFTMHKVGKRPPHHQSIEWFDPLVMLGLAKKLARVVRGEDASRVFASSIECAAAASKPDAERDAARVKGLDDESLGAACRVTMYGLNPDAREQTRRNIAGFTYHDPTFENLTCLVDNLLRVVEHDLDIDWSVRVNDDDTAPDVHSVVRLMTPSRLLDVRIAQAAPNSDALLQPIVWYAMMCSGMVPKPRGFETDADHIMRVGVYNVRRAELYTIDVCDIESALLSDIFREIDIASGR